MSKDKRKALEQAPPAPAAKIETPPAPPPPFWAQLVQSWRWLPAKAIKAAIAGLCKAEGGPRAVADVWLNGGAEMRSLAANALRELIGEVISSRGAVPGAAGIVEAAGLLPQEPFPLLPLAAKTLEDNPAAPPVNSNPS